ncbi:hypothetical protein [Yeosuana marina]|uniref:hypothetical protein n=1 Tax=Yeosuana marina TaxID=1565536 RepID=UPI0030C863FB
MLVFAILVSCSSSVDNASSGDVLVKSISINGSNIEDGTIKQLSISELPNNAEDKIVMS